MNTDNPGKRFEAVVNARQRLRVVHWVLGVVGSFIVWTGPPPGHFDAFSRGGGWIMIVLSVLGWGPYLVSWLYSRLVLDGSGRGVSVFGAGAVVVTLAAAGLYQGGFGFPRDVPALLISACVTVTLVGWAKVCASIWGRVIPAE